MMHVDKNADDHVMDQNVNRISREIAYVPFSGRIRSKQDMLTNGHDKMRISIVILNFGHASHRFDGFEVLDVLPRGPMDLNLDVLPRGPMV